MNEVLLKSHMIIRINIFLGLKQHAKFNNMIKIQQNK
jgi:hypothetical protein